MMYDIAPSFWKQEVGDLKKNFFHNRIKKLGSWSEKSVTLFSLSDPLGTTNEEKVTAA